MTFTNCRKFNVIRGLAAGMNPLAQWLKENRVTQVAFAKRIGMSASYVSLLCSDPLSFWPSLDVWTRIRDETDGAITPNDFLPASPPVASEAAAAEAAE